MTESGQRSGLVLAGPREMLLPATIAVCFVLYYVAHQSFGIVAAFAAPMLALYALAPSWAARSMADFDRDVVRLLATGQRDSLARRYDRSLGMRLFAAPALSAERRALVAAENGKPRVARLEYRQALDHYDNNPPLRVLLGYAHASYQTAEDAEAIRVYRVLLESAGALPGVEQNLAHAMIRSGEDVRAALQIVVAAGNASSERREELRLLEALAHAMLGDAPKARRLAEGASAASSDLAQGVRREIEEALKAGTIPRLF